MSTTYTVEPQVTTGTDKHRNCVSVTYPNSGYVRQPPSMYQWFSEPSLFTIAAIPTVGTASIG